MDHKDFNNQLFVILLDFFVSYVVQNLRGSERALELVIGTAHLAIFDKRLVDQLDGERDLARFFESRRPVERLVEGLAGGEAAVPAQKHDLILLQGLGQVLRHLRCARCKLFPDHRHLLQQI